MVDLIHEAPARPAAAAPKARSGTAPRPQPQVAADGASPVRPGEKQEGPWIDAKAARWLPRVIPLMAVMVLVVGLLGLSGA